jgi:hypothetical protein
MLPKIVKESSVQAIIDDTPVPEDMYFSSTFPGDQNYPDEEIKFSIFHNGEGMAPITDRGVKAPEYKGGGFSEMTVKGALINEKYVYTEEELNRTLSADPVRAQAAEMLVMNSLDDLVRRCQMRKEWLAAQIACNAGVISYADKRGTTFSIDYNIPAANKVTLTGNYVWGTGSTRNPIGDCYDMKTRLEKYTGGKLSAVLVNSTTFANMLFEDTTLRDLMKLDAYRGQYNPMSKRWEAFSELMDMPFVKYDQQINVVCRMTSAVSTKTFSVDNALDLKAGATVQFCRGDENDFEVLEEEVIDSISGDAVTLVAAPTATFVPGRDFIRAAVPFLADNRLVFMVNQFRGRPLMKWFNAPVGLGSTRYGMIPKTWMGTDPDAVKTRIQCLGVWTIATNQAFGILDVA